MKKNLLIAVSFLFALLVVPNVYAQNSDSKLITPTGQKGTLQESFKMNSKILKSNVNYSIYFPNGYNDSNRKYPVVYLLHGYTDDETGWTQFGEIDRLADAAIAAGEIPPMIIVMPDAKVTWYVNDAAGKKRYEDFFIQEFIPFIDKTFKTRAKKDFRAITGLSMGGYGSLIYAMKHPDMFVASAPLSAAIYTEETVKDYEQERWNNIEGLMYGKDLAGEARITDHWKANNPFYMLKNLKVEDLKKVKYYFDCGDDDFLYEGNSKIHIEFRKLEIPHEFRIRDGVHDWTYWRDGIIPALKFIGKSFHR